MTSQLKPRSEYLEAPGIIGLKAEFEAEGSTFEEIAGLSSLANKLPLGLTIKIGGCEAVTDLVQSLALAPSQIVAPMIESPFAVQKFGQMIAKWDPEHNVRRLINVETVQAIEHLVDILDACTKFEIDGVVIGRGDLAESLGQSRSSVESSEIQAISAEILREASGRNLSVGIGGGVSSASIEGLLVLADHENFQYFETRKVLINVRADNLEENVRLALAFELSWLEDRASKASLVSDADVGRIERLSRELGIR